MIRCDRRVFVGNIVLGAAALTAHSVVGPGAALFAQSPAAVPRPNPNFPQAPTWEAELREIAPGVYAYVQAGGPGRDNVSVCRWRRRTRGVMTPAVDTEGNRTATEEYSLVRSGRL